MKKVIVQYDDKVRFFNNVTKVQCFLACDMFENTIKIFQGKKVTTIKQYEIIGFEVVEE
nr:MAG TPA: hypothetical protein [Caudoviricetes sp.]